VSFCPLSSGHCVVCPSLIYSFCFPLRYLQIVRVLLSSFFWSLCCLSFFQLRLLITPSVSSISPCPVVLFLLAIELSALL
jgi:hypothetical protein